MYRPIVVIDTTAKNAYWKPALLPLSAGSVMMSAKTALAITEYTGTRRLSTARQICQPGTARSRENAYHVRDALVRQPSPQKSCPTVEMRITTSAQCELIALSKTAIEPPPPLLIAEMSLAAKVIASSTSQPITAAQKTEVQRPRAALRSA